jgi:histidinol dehydrogenase
LITFSQDYANQVEAAIEKTVEKSTRKEITTQSLTNKGLIVVCDSLEQAIHTINVIAPEHLELHVAGAMELLGSIRNAGAIFMGEWTPEAVGDYVAGPNHTLPTGGTARFSSPLSVDEFVKKSSVIQYTAQALANDAHAIETIADHEGLWAHAQSVRLRRQLIENGAAAAVEANAKECD